MLSTYLTLFFDRLKGVEKDQEQPPEKLPESEMATDLNGLNLQLKVIDLDIVCLELRFASFERDNTVNPFKRYRLAKRIKELDAELNRLVAEGRAIVKAAA